MVKNVGSNEESLGLIPLLFMKRENLLNSVGSILLLEAILLRLRLSVSLGLQVVLEIVVDEVSFFECSQS